MIAAISSRFETLWNEASTIWVSGGWAMVAIAVIAFVMFAMGMHIYLKLLGKGFRSLPEKSWRRWIEHPERRRGPVGDLLDSVSEAKTLEDAVRRFEEIRAAEATPFARDLRVMRICVSAAPLVGLLGTVTGMLATFGAHLPALIEINGELRPPLKKDSKPKSRMKARRASSMSMPLRVLAKFRSILKSLKLT